MKKSKKNKHPKWIASDKFKGVRYYIDKSKKHGSRFDTFYGIRYQIDNKRYEYNLGYASQGWTEQKAALEIEKYKIASDQGTGAISKTEQRKINQKKRIEQAQLEEEEKRKKITFSEYFEYYINAQAHKSQNTILAEKHLYKKWLKPVLGNIPFINIKPYHLEEVKVNMLAKNRAAATIKYAFSVVSQMWTLAKRDDLVFTDCPTKKVRLPKQDNARQRFLKEEEAKLLLDELRSHSEQLYEISLIALFTGMRFGEIVNLEWSCIDFESKIIMIKDTKAHKNRIAYMLDDLYNLFNNKRKEAIELGYNLNGLIFTNLLGEKISEVSHTFDRVAYKLFNQNLKDKRDKVVFHTLRHTYASWLVQRKVDLFSVKELMGHASIKMTLRYSHHSPDGLRKMAFILNDLNLK